MVVFVLVLKWLTGVFDAEYLNPEGPINVAPEDNPTSEPEPDFAVLSKIATEYANNPPPSDVRLLIEVSDTTLTFDLGPKARLYARAGIPDYWVFDVAGKRIIAHRGPLGGIYQDVTMYREGEEIAPLAAPDRFLKVSSVFRQPSE